MKHINILTLLFSLTILVGLWTIQSGTDSVLSVRETLAQDYGSSTDTPSTIDTPSEISSDVSSDTGSDTQCTEPSLVCCNPYGQHIGRPLGECEECNYTPGACDSGSDVPSASDADSASSSDYDSASSSDYDSASSSDYDSASASDYDSASDYKTPVCCTAGNKNYVKNPGQNEKCNSEVCDPCDEYICCNSNATNHVPVGDRPTGDDNCAPPHTTCRSDTPTCEFDNCDPAEDPGCEGGCEATSSCSLNNGIVSVSGEGASSYPAGSGCTAAGASAEATAACSSITPDMPVGSTIVYSAFAAAIVTGRDVCLNLPGDQQSIPAGYHRAADGSCQSDQDECEDAGGTWIAAQNICINPVPACGFAAGQSNLQNPPTTGLCDPGSPTPVNATTNSYTWICKDTTVGQYGVDCSAGRCTGEDCATNDLCNNIAGVQDAQYLIDNNLSRTTDGECYPNEIDLCSNIAGVQNTAYLSTNNLFRDEYGRCWDDSGAACGTAMNMLTWATAPQNNLCDPSSTATPVIADDVNLKYNWSCLDQDGHTVGSCSVNMLCGSNEKNCKGRCIPKTETCLETATTTLIQIFKVVPRIVQKATDTCTLSWTVSNSNPDPETPLKCSINGVDVTNFNSSKSVVPGVQRIFCTLGEEYQEKSARCEINPEYKEI